MLSFKSLITGPCLGLRVAQPLADGFGVASPAFLYPDRNKPDVATEWFLALLCLFRGTLQGVDSYISRKLHQLPFALTELFKI